MRSELVEHPGSITDGKPPINVRWDDLVLADETMILDHQSDDLSASSIAPGIGRDTMCADADRIAFAALSEQSLCTRIDHARVWLPTIVIDYHAFSDRQDHASDICLGFRGPASKIVGLIADFFIERGLTVAMNDPIRGCSLPRCYDGHDSVIGLTLAFHEGLFVRGKDQRKPDQVKVWLNKLYTELYSYFY